MQSPGVGFAGHKCAFKLFLTPALQWPTAIQELSPEAAAFVQTCCSPSCLLLLPFISYSAHHIFWGEKLPSPLRKALGKPGAVGCSWSVERQWMKWAMSGSSAWITPAHSHAIMQHVWCSLVKLCHNICLLTLKVLGSKFLICPSRGGHALQFCATRA